MTARLVLSFLITWGYTVYLFPGDAAHSLFFAAFCLWLFGAFLLSALLFGSAVSGSTYGCLLITADVFIACMLLNVLPAVHKFNPASLASDNMALIQNTLECSDLYRALGITGALTIGHCPARCFAEQNPSFSAPKCVFCILCASLCDDALRYFRL